MQHYDKISRRLVVKNKENSRKGTAEYVIRNSSKNSKNRFLLLRREPHDVQFLLLTKLYKLYYIILIILY